VVARAQRQTPSLGSFENSPDDRAACVRISSGRIVSLSAQALRCKLPGISLTLDFVHSGRIAKCFGQVLYEPPRHFYRIGVCGQRAKSRVRPQLLSHQRQSIGEGRAGFAIPRRLPDGLRMACGWPACFASSACGRTGQRSRTTPTTPEWSSGLLALRPLSLRFHAQVSTCFLEGRLHLPTLKTNHLTICSGPAPRSVHSKPWVANSPLGSRTNTQRMGTAGNPVLYQTAVAEDPSTVRSPLPYQSSTVAGTQSVEGSLATTERFGRRLPFRRGLPICPALRGGAALVECAASNLKRVMNVTGLGKKRRQLASSRRLA
jgi:hypothetical protein